MDAKQLKESKKAIKAIITDYFDAGDATKDSKADTVEHILSIVERAYDQGYREGKNYARETINALINDLLQPGGANALR